MLDLDDILRTVRSYRPEADLDLIRKAYVYSARCHEGQVRKSGDPYLTHPLAVADILARMQLDESSICTGLLHDTVEDTSATLADVQRLFGATIASLVDGVTKLSRVHFRSSEEKQAENFRKMLVAMSRDIRVLLVKLADRLHNMRTLRHHQDPAKQKAIAQETLEIYAPLANRLGIGWLRSELEDLSFKYLRPGDYQHLTAQIGRSGQERTALTENVLQRIRRALRQAGLTQAEVTGRPKHLWSIFRKMADKKVPLDQLHDLIAFRVLVDNVQQCYAVLGLLHGLYKPIPGRFKDYIAMPKPNGYQSLHTALLGPGASVPSIGERIEVQIRTRRMDQVAELGIAAHWQYKERYAAIPTDDKDQRRFTWLRRLMHWQRNLADAGEFLDSVRLDLFTDEVYIFTPRGDVVELPRRATPLDFAFAIHSDIGLHCHGARVNGRMVPLRHVLRSGDTCEVVTSPAQRPKRRWLEFVRTSKARTRIRSALRELERWHCKEVGLHMLDKELRAYDTSLKKLLKEKKADDLLQHLPYQGLDELLLALGYGQAEPDKVVQRLLPAPLQTKVTAGSRQPTPYGRLLRRLQEHPRAAIRIDDIDDVLVSYARCCNPVKGEPVVGFVTRGRGLTVHRRGCPRVRELEPQRRLEVSWGDAARLVRPVAIEVLVEDRHGMLQQLSAVFAHLGINLSEARVRQRGDGWSVVTFACGVTDISQLRRLMADLQDIRGVHSMKRVSGAPAEKGDG